MVMMTFYDNCMAHESFSTHGKTPKKYQVFLDKSKLYCKNPVEELMHVYQWGLSDGAGLWLDHDPPGSW